MGACTARCGEATRRRARRAPRTPRRGDARRMRLSLAIEAFAAHLERVRRLSSATVRAYRGDLGDLRDAIGDLELGEIDLEHLREWLWAATKRGDARSTLARRTSSARAFFAWALEEELVPTDPSLRLVSPKRGRTLPQVATADALRGVLDAVAVAAADGDPVALRDHAALELLYGAGIRVSELCGLDIDDLDLDRATVRVLGKGSKERVVPFGVPAGRAVGAYRRAQRQDRGGLHRARAGDGVRAAPRGRG